MTGENVLGAANLQLFFFGGPDVRKISLVQQVFGYPLIERRMAA
jgi:hypothetical protein